MYVCVCVYILIFLNYKYFFTIVTRILDCSIMRRIVKDFFNKEMFFNSYLRSTHLRIFFLATKNLPEHFRFFAFAQNKRIAKKIK